MGRGGAGRLRLLSFLKNLLLTLIHRLGHISLGVFRLARCPLRCPLLPRHGLGCPLGYLLLRKRLIHRLRHGLAWNLTQNLRGKPSLARYRLLRHRLR